MNGSPPAAPDGNARVVAVSRDGAHRFSKVPMPEIDVIAGLGVQSDAHAGKKVRHRSRVRANPDQPNLRQVHLLHAELLEELRGAGFALAPGDLGENVLTSGIDLLGLPRHALLLIGEKAVLRVTGLRNPCAQIEAFAPGLLRHVAIRSGDEIVRKAGIMAVVIESGPIAPGDPI